MAKSETTTEDYEDHRTHLAKQPYDILIGWAVVCCLALGVIVGFSAPLFPRFGPGSPGHEGANLAPVASPFLHGDEATLADEIGMVPKPKD